MTGNSEGSSLKVAERKWGHGVGVVVRGLTRTKFPYRKVKKGGKKKTQTYGVKRGKNTGKTERPPLPGKGGVRF